MFTATFLGHQGWLFSAEGGDASTHVLVDPLLVESFGHGGHIGAVHPPRAWDLSAMPRIDAVLLTHEHEDHFSIPSLSLIDRRVPVLLSARSSAAARAILGDMGFQLRLVEGGDVAEIGDLILHFFDVDHLTQSEMDEWDVIPFLVRDRAGHGSLFSSVDTSASDLTILSVRRIVPDLALWTVTNNANDWSCSSVSDPDTRRTTAVRAFSHVVSELERVQSVWPRNVAALVCGGGFALTGERAWMNGQIFPCDSEAVCRALSDLMPWQRIAAPQPGERWRLVRGRLDSVDEQSAFLRPRERGQWPDRKLASSMQRLEHYGPVTGRERLSAQDLDALSVGLERVAVHFYADTAFRALNSLRSVHTARGRKPNFALALRDASDLHVFAYSTHRCSFERTASSTPMQDYLLGIELWGTDFLALLRGELAPTAVAFGCARSWCFDARLTSALFRFWWLFHPLRSPDAFLRLYRGLLADTADTVPLIMPTRR